jgi:uncharacterized membrane-anchored protein YhcB (DUF1043 family)
MDKLTVFIAVTAAAVVLQTVILGAMFLAMRKTAANLDALSNEVRSKALPAIEQAQATLAEIRPQMSSILDNVNESTAMIRGHVTRLDATLFRALMGEQLPGQMQTCKTQAPVTKDAPKLRPKSRSEGSPILG